MTRIHYHRGLRQSMLALGLILCTTLPAVADDDRRLPRTPVLPKYQQECSSCHIAYPPGMLPASSWQRVMNTLDRHYGTDASLDADSVRQIATWLKANAGTAKRVTESPPEDRITRSAWFVREHDEVPASAWKHAQVKTPANCAACHPKADQGDFNEHDVRIPR